jgi:hypothetical protein
MPQRFRSRASRACLEGVVLRLREVVAASLLLALALTQALAAPGHHADPLRTPQVSEVVHAAEAALARGDAQAATEMFERAASLEHALDIEVGLVRGLMQAGHYRRAVAFAAHTSGAHAEQTGGVALYAWLLAAGGQGAFAQRLLGETEQRLPGDALISDVRQRLKEATSASGPVPAATLPGFAPAGTVVELDRDREPHVRDAVAMPPGSRMVATGLLIDRGQRAIAPSALLAKAASIWVRNGLGQTVAASLERRIDGLGLTVLRLHSPLDGTQSLAVAERDAFPGAPAYAIEYLRSADAAPAWPWLHSGFLGTADAALGNRRLGIGLPPGPRGGPVFDGRGQLIGLTQADPGRPDRLLPASALHVELGESFGAAAAPPVVARMAMDELYERALWATLQIITAP